jgi:hypothetical protein
MFCHSHSALLAKPIPIPSCHSVLFPLPAKLIPIPGCHSMFCPIPPPTKLIPIPMCIPRLAKIKLKNTNVVPMGFEPATPQANVLVATTTPHVCLCQYLLQ